MQKDRKLYLDLIKIAGSFFIVMLHLNSSSVHSVYGSIPEKQELIIHMLHQLFYTAVPVFMITTGAGFLATDHFMTYQSMGRHILKIALSILFFGCLFWLTEAVYLHTSVWDIRGMLIAVLTNNTWSHMWYLYPLLGVYLCIPLFSSFINHAETREAVILCGVFFFFQCIGPWMAGIIGFVPSEVMPVKGMWFFYTLAGGIIGRMSHETMKRFFLPSLAGTLITLVRILHLGYQGAGVVLTESDPVVAVFAVSMFSLLKIVCHDLKAPRPVAEVSKYALGIYIIHPIFINILLKIVGWNPQLYLPGISLPVTGICIWGVSAVCVGLYSSLLALVRRKRACARRKRI